VSEAAFDSPPEQLPDSHRKPARPRLNRNVVLAQTGMAISELGSYAYGTAIVLWSYHAGGAALVGAWQSVRLLMSAGISPVAGYVADLFPRRAFMVWCNLVSAMVAVLVAICVQMDVAVIAVTVVGTLSTLVGSGFDAIAGGLNSELAETPQELATANAAWEVIKGAAVFVGPALGGAALAFVGTDSVLWANAVSFAICAVLLGLVTMPARRAVARKAEWRTFLHGTRLLFTLDDVRAPVAISLLQRAQTGVLGVLLVVVAVHVIDFGSGGVGYLNAVMGIGTVLGGAVVLRRTRAGRPGLDMTVGTGIAGLAFIALGALPWVGAALVALAAIGAAGPWVNVGFRTIPQRVVAHRVIGQFFGSANAMQRLASAVGGMVATLLLHLVGLRATLIVAGALSLVIGWAASAALRSADERLKPPRLLEFVRGISLFAPLGLITQERLARSLTERRVGPGTVIMAEGGEAHHFYLIESGRVRITQGDRVLRDEGPGEFFGEIALLHDVPRTATVTAIQPCVLQLLTREDFLDAVSDERAYGAADEVAASRMAF